MLVSRSKVEKCSGEEKFARDFEGRWWCSSSILVVSAAARQDVEVFDIVSELSGFIEDVKQGGGGGAVWACGFTDK